MTRHAFLFRSAALGVLLLASAAASAATLTWKGGTSGKLSAAANWTPAQAPAAGDTLVFNTTGVKLEAETFDIGEAGLTIELGPTLSSADRALFANVTFAGAGRITLTGGGWLRLTSANSTFAGGTLVSNAVVNSYDAKSTQFGTGPIEFLRPTSATSMSRLQLSSWGCTVNNDLVFSQLEEYLQKWEAVSCANRAYLKGRVSANCDLMFTSGYGGIDLSGDVEMAGRTLTFKSENTRSEDAYQSWLRGSVNGNLTKTGQRPLLLFGVSRGLSHTLLVAQGDLQMQPTARWVGTNVVANGSTAVLTLSSSANLVPEATLALENAARLCVNAPAAAVGRFRLGDGELPAGVYSAKTLPDAIEGPGLLVVGDAARVVSTWKGGASGIWHSPANWDNGVPTTGGVAIFTNAVTVTASSVVLDARGLRIQNEAKVTFSTGATFSGAGKLTKGGSGELVFQNYDVPNSHAGGTLLEDGVLRVGGAKASGSTPAKAASLGAGAVEIRREAGKVTYLACEASVVLNNRITVTGPFSPDLADRHSLWLNDDASLTGPIVAEGDFEIMNSRSTADTPGSILGDIYAHGHVCYLRGGTGKSATTLRGSVDASLVKLPQKTPTWTAGAFTDAASRFEVWGATNHLDAAARLACNTLVVSNAAFAATLRVEAAANVAETAVLRCHAGGQVWIPTADVNVHVRELWLDGKRQPDGAYSKGVAPEGAAAAAKSLVVGSGILRVGANGLVSVLL